MRTPIVITRTTRTTTPAEPAFLPQPRQATVNSRELAVTWRELAVTWRALAVTWRVADFTSRVVAFASLAATVTPRAGDFTGIVATFTSRAVDFTAIAAAFTGIAVNLTTIIGKFTTIAVPLTLWVIAVASCGVYDDRYMAQINDATAKMLAVAVIGFAPPIGAVIGQVVGSLFTDDDTMLQVSRIVGALIAIGLLFPTAPLWFRIPRDTDGQ